MAINNVEYIFCSLITPGERTNFISRESAEAFLQRRGRKRPVVDLAIRGRNRHGLRTSVTWSLGRIATVAEFRDVLNKPGTRAKITYLENSESYSIR